jgi:hypothetical protein
VTWRYLGWPVYGLTPANDAAEQVKFYQDKFQRHPPAKHNNRLAAVAARALWHDDLTIDLPLARSALAQGLVPVPRQRRKQIADDRA